MNVWCILDELWSGVWTQRIRSRSSTDFHFDLFWLVWHRFYWDWLICWISTWRYTLTLEDCRRRIWSTYNITLLSGRLCSISRVFSSLSLSPVVKEKIIFHSIQYNRAYRRNSFLFCDDKNAFFDSNTSRMDEDDLVSCRQHIATASRAGFRGLKRSATLVPFQRTIVYIRSSSFLVF